MVNCCVPLCKSRQGSSHSEGIKYHEIPSAKELREKWLASISRQGACKGSRWVPTDYSRVCSLHFRSEDYRENCKKRILKPGVIPSIFPAYPSYLQSRKITPRKERTTSVNKKSEVELCGNSGKYLIKNKFFNICLNFFYLSIVARRKFFCFVLFFFRWVK